jgi:hypothetical protein
MGELGELHGGSVLLGDQCGELVQPATRLRVGRCVDQHPRTRTAFVVVVGIQTAFAIALALVSPRGVDTAEAAPAHAAEAAPAHAAEAAPADVVAAAA